QNVRFIHWAPFRLIPTGVLGSAGRLLPNSRTLIVVGSPVTAIEVSESLLAALLTSKAREREYRHRSAGQHSRHECGAYGPDPELRTHFRSTSQSGRDPG